MAESKATVHTIEGYLQHRRQRATERRITQQHSQGVTDQDLQLLSTWHEDQLGFALDMHLAIKIRDLCEDFGYGRVPQIAQQIGTLWRGDDKTRQDFRALRQDMMAKMPTPEFFAKLDRDEARRQRRRERLTQMKRSEPYPLRSRKATIELSNDNA